MEYGGIDMGSDNKNGKWLDSKQARKELQVSSCDLSHIREAGKLSYRKTGNAFRYSSQDIQKLKKARKG
jgi:hypothetical protein